jgi:hypothetical protein
MKVSIDGILGSANSINSRRSTEKNSSSKEIKNAGDSVQIDSRVNSRLDGIDSDLKELQSSLSKNQVIKNGLSRLLEEIEQGGSKSRDILAETKYEGKNVLSDFLGKNEVPDANLIRQKIGENQNFINSDMSRLTKIQIETENIFASNLAGSDRYEKSFKTVETQFVMGEMTASNRLTSLNADIVMKLIR